MINNRKIVSTIKITVLGFDAVKFGRAGSRKTPVVSTSMLKMKVGMHCKILVHIHENTWRLILVHIHENTWRLILENSNSNNQR
jgi:hypothetical protein